MEPRESISHIRMTGLHGCQEIRASFKPGLNIVHGKNGTGKTTLLHVIANLLERDIERFCHLKFKEISINLHSGTSFRLVQRRHAGSKTEVDLYIGSRRVESTKAGDTLPPSTDQLLRGILKSSPVYLPAFRSILDAASRRPSRNYTHDSESDLHEFNSIVSKERNAIMTGDQTHGIYFSPTDIATSIAQKTILCRNWFGRFTPTIRYPSLNDVTRSLLYESNHAVTQMSGIDREILSNVFGRVLEAILHEQTTDGSTASRELPNDLHQKISSLKHYKSNLAPIHNSISSLIERAQEDTSPASNLAKAILNIYDTAIDSRNESLKKAFHHVNTFTESVNKFLENKYIQIDMNAPTSREIAISITLSNNQQASFNVLSSGERQVLTLLFCGTHMSATEGVVLIDEPELSLHVDWQRLILGELVRQAEDRQVIACTHSPEVAADHQDSLVEIQSRVDSSIEPSSNEEDVIELE